MTNKSTNGTKDSSFNDAIQSQITYLRDAIEFKVSKGDVVNQMKIEAGSIIFSDETMKKFNDWDKDLTNEFGESIREQLAKEQNKRKEIQFQENVELKRSFEELAKHSVFFYDGLLKHGLGKDEAMKLTAMYLSNLPK